jgi:hypothetical protein
MLLLGYLAGVRKEEKTDHNMDEKTEGGELNE